jgi:hypothetical protein
MIGFVQRILLDFTFLNLGVFPFFPLLDFSPFFFAPDGDPFFDKLAFFSFCFDRDGDFPCSCLLSLLPLCFDMVRDAELKLEGLSTLLGVARLNLLPS